MTDQLGIMKYMGECVCVSEQGGSRQNGQLKHRDGQVNRGASQD